MKVGLTVFLSLVVFLRASAGVLPPDAVVEGNTFSQWSAAWWKWALLQSANEHPLFDETGAWAHHGQPESSVFFLAGVFNESGSAQRSFTVPEGKFLFFPLINVFTDNVFVDPPLSVEELRDQAAAYVNVATNLHATIDSISTPDLLAYRVRSPVFNVEHLQEDNIATVIAGTPILGLIDPMVSDGYWLMVEPLPPGEHIVRFSGTFGSPINFTVDITDVITVVPLPLDEKVEGLLTQLKQAGLPNQRVRLLSRSLLRAQSAFEDGRLRSGIRHLHTFQNLTRVLLSRSYPDIARDLIESAQEIVDRAKQQVPPRRHTDNNHEEDEHEADEDDDSN